MENSVTKTEQETSPEVEGLSENLWVEIEGQSPPELAKILEEQLKNHLENLDYEISWTKVTQRGKTVVHNFFHNFFKSGLKNPEVLEKGNFRFRFVPVPRQFLEKGGEKIVLAKAYEIEIHLAPRYQASGEEGDYKMMFILNAKFTHPKEKSYASKKAITIRTTPDTNTYNRTKKVIGGRREEKERTSRENWASAIQEGLSKTFQGGLPGLGKKR